MEKEDLRLLIIAAFRYALVRKNYVQNFITGVIKDNSEVFHDQDWKRFISEVVECEDLEDPFDIEAWREFIAFCEEKAKGDSISSYH